MENHRRQFSPQFKAQVVMEALSQMNTLAEIASRHQVHPTQIMQWKARFLKEASSIFSDLRRNKTEEKDKLIEELYRQIGQSKVELDWLKKKAGFIP